MILEKTFGETVRKLRDERQLRLREVADALKIDISTLAKIEKNTRKPTKQVIEKLAMYFSVSEKDLMVAFISDSVAYQVMDEEEFATEVLKVAEQKVQYLKTKKTS